MDCENKCIESLNLNKKLNCMNNICAMEIDKFKIKAKKNECLYGFKIIQSVSNIDNPIFKCQCFDSLLVYGKNCDLIRTNICQNGSLTFSKISNKFTCECKTNFQKIVLKLNIFSSFESCFDKNQTTLLESMMEF